MAVKAVIDTNVWISALLNPQYLFFFAFHPPLIPPLAEVVFLLPDQNIPLYNDI